MWGQSDLDIKMLYHEDILDFVANVLCLALSFRVKYGTIPFYQCGWYKYRITICCCVFSGQIGIYIDINDAEPIHPREYGTHFYFLRECTDNFLTEMSKVSFDVLKGVFERKDLMADCIVEGYHEGK